MKQQSPTPIVLDTSILLNFVKIGRVELLGQLSTSVVLLDQVLDEVTDVTQLLSCLRKQASRLPLGGSDFGVLRPTAERLD